MSNYFDPTAKENKVIIDYFENKKWLVIEPSLSTRSSIKKSLTQIGAKQANMVDTDNLKMALELITLHKPDYILTNKFFTGGSVTDIFFHHLTSNPNRMNSGFYVITEENSLSEVAHALNYEMDGLISFPFTASNIISSVVQGVKPKITPNKYLLKFNQGKEQFLSGNSDFAQTFLEEALLLDNHPYEALYYLGEIHSQKNDIKEAIKHYEEALVHNENHYRTLYNLSKLYSKDGHYDMAYELSVNLVRKFPTPPEMIPDLVRLSIINKKYADIVNYYRLFSKLENPSADTQKSISAGLTILGIYFSNHHENEKAKDILLRALKYSNGKYEILESITKTFKKMNELEFLLAEFDNTDFTLWPESAQGFHFHALHLTSNDHQTVLSFGEKLLRAKIKNYYIDHDMIERGIMANRKLGVLEAMVMDAVKKFPEKSIVFENLLKKAKEQLP